MTVGILCGRSFSSLLLLSVLGLVTNAQENVYEFRMPGVRTYKNDAYLCYAEDFLKNTTFITGFEPIHDPEVTHHMILFGCEEPGSQNTVWHCGDSDQSEPVCNKRSKILFSWAMNAPSFIMPPDTSLPIGGHLFRYLVLQVHYKDSSAFDKTPGKRDQSGWKLKVQSKPTANVGGVYLFASGQDVPANSNSTLTVACTYTGSAVLHPFAFRVHAHSHGVVNEGYVLHKGHPYLIGAQSPQKPQTFYPVKNTTLKVYPGDMLMAQCNMTNKENRDIHIGHTRTDEMCNFYMMYSVDLKNIAQLDDPYNQDCDNDEPPGLARLLEMTAEKHLQSPVEDELEELLIPIAEFEEDPEYLGE